MLVSIELFSKGVIYAYRNYFSSDISKKLEKESEEQLKTSNQNTDYLMSSDYINSVSEDIQKLKTKFSSYIVWDQVPLNTKNINIKSSGFRKNREDIAAKNADKVIWFLGGLYGWGYKVADNHTIPSLLQDNINAYLEEISDSYIHPNRLWAVNKSDSPLTISSYEYVEATIYSNQPFSKILMNKIKTNKTLLKPY